MEITPQIRNDFYSLLEDRPKSKEIIESFSGISNLILFGGCIRDYFDNDGFSVLPRDFDIVLSDIKVNLDNLMESIDVEAKRNKFGGYKIKADDLEFDVWEIEKTWAFKEQKVEFKSYKDLKETVFLNIDSLFYNLKTCELYDDDFNQVLRSNYLDIVLKENPYPELNLLRAFKFIEKYNLELSNNLSEFFSEWIKSYDDIDQAIAKLHQIEVKRSKGTAMDQDKLGKVIEDSTGLIKNNKQLKVMG